RGRARNPQATFSDPTAPLLAEDTGPLAKACHYPQLCKMRISSRNVLAGPKSRRGWPVYRIETQIVPFFLFFGGAALDCFYVSMVHERPESAWDSVCKCRAAEKQKE